MFVPVTKTGVTVCVCVLRCKLFYKKEAEFKEKGVGTLHLKQTADGKTQMIIRADTNLGKNGTDAPEGRELPLLVEWRRRGHVVCV